MGRDHGISVIEDQKGDLKSIKADDELREFINQVVKDVGDVHIIREDNGDVASEVLLLASADRRIEPLQIRFAVDYAGVWHRI
jgi:hypothetical protein